MAAHIDRREFLRLAGLGGVVFAPRPAMSFRTWQVLLLATASLVGLLAILGTSTHLMAQETEPAIQIQAKRFEFTPTQIVLKRGVPVILELTSLDVVHGFNVPGLGIRADVLPGQTTRVRLVPDKVGRFDYRCDHFCGLGHWKVKGTIVVED
jgi:cytochrome c oxidase subunit II